MADVIEVKGHNGTVRFDGHCITIIRKGCLAGASIGKAEKQMPIGTVTAVQFKPAGPMVNGFIQFTIGGGNEVRSRAGHQTKDASRDENSVISHYGQRKAFEQLRALVQAAIVTFHARTEVTTVDVSSIPEQIRQLAELRDGGAITHAEYEAKKSELLDRM